MSLYETVWPQRWPLGLIERHLAACRRAQLPLAPASPVRECAAQQVVFAPHSLVVSQELSDACIADACCRDIPMPGTRVAAGQPFCTVVVRAPTREALQRALDEAHARILDRIENPSREFRHVFTAFHA